MRISEFVMPGAGFKAICDNSEAIPFYSDTDKEIEDIEKLIRESKYKDVRDIGIREIKTPLIFRYMTDVEEVRLCGGMAEVTPYILKSLIGDVRSEREKEYFTEMGFYHDILETIKKLSEHGQLLVKLYMDNSRDEMQYKTIDDWDAFRLYSYF